MHIKKEATTITLEILENVKRLGLTRPSKKKNYPNGLMPYKIWSLTTAIETVKDCF